MREFHIVLICLLVAAGAGVEASAQYEDNITEIDTAYPEFFAELLDVELRGDRAYVTGVGGFVIYDISDSTNIHEVGRYQPPGHPWVRFYQGDVKGTVGYGAGRLDGIFVLDISREFSPEFVTSITTNALGRRVSIEGVMVHGDVLYAAAHGDGLLVYDITDPLSPIPMPPRIDDLTNAWTVGVFDALLLVADGGGGLAIYETSDPLSPGKVAHVRTTSTAQDVVAHAGFAYVANGAGGVDIFDIRRPEAPLLIKNIATLGPAAHISLADEYLYVASWELLEVYAVADPDKAFLVATETTPGRTMGVAAHNNVAYVADWYAFRAFGFSDIPNPDVRSFPFELDFGPVPFGETEQDTLYIQNVGRAPLEVDGVMATTRDFNPLESAFTVPPGETYPLAIDLTPQNEGLVTGALSLTSDDPDQSVVRVALWGQRHELQVGDDAHDFILPTTTGIDWQLSEHFGTPILISFFASW